MAQRNTGAYLVSRKQNKTRGANLSFFQSRKMYVKAKIRSKRNKKRTL